MRFTIQYSATAYDCDQVQADKLTFVPSCLKSGNTMRKQVHIHGTATGSQSPGTPARTISMSMAASEARLLGHQLLASADMVDAKAYRLELKLQAEDNARIGTLGAVLHGRRTREGQE